MKHSLWNKLALILLCALIIAGGMEAVGIALHITDGELLTGLIRDIGQSIPAAIVTVIIVLAVLALALYVLYVYLFGAQSGREQNRSVMIREGENGSLQISAQALQTMVQQYCKHVASIQKCECEELPYGKEAALRLHIALAPETDIADEIVKIQDGLREYLLQACGLTVTKVDITIIPNNE